MVEFKPGGYSPKIWVVVCGTLLETFTYLRPKYIFPTQPISDLIPKMLEKLYTLFQTSRQNIPNLRPKCSKSTPIFRPKRLKNHTLWRRTYLYSLYKREPPPPQEFNTQFCLKTISLYFRM